MNTIPKQLVLFPTGTLNPLERDRMTEQGFIAVECDDPSKVVVALPATSLLKADDVLLSALNAITGEGSRDERNKFAFNLITQINHNAAKKSYYEQPIT